MPCFRVPRQTYFCLVLSQEGIPGISEDSDRFDSMILYLHGSCNIACHHAPHKADKFPCNCCFSHICLLAGMGSKVFGNGGVTPDDIAYQRYWDEGVSEVFESGSEIQTIHNRFPNEIQSGRWFNYSIGNGKIYLENGIQEVDFVIDMNGNLRLGRGHSALANGADVQAAGTIKINSQGYVRSITNELGHYTPTVTQGETFPSLLNQLGIRTKNAWLELGDYCLTQSGYVEQLKRGK